MYSQAQRRPNHERRTTTQLNRVRRSHRQPPRTQRLPRAPRVVSRWAVDRQGRLVLQWSPARPDLARPSIGSDEPMADLDGVRSTERGVRLRGFVT